jgi:hypothetical protein
VDIDRIVQMLDSDIAAEEEQAGVFDPSQAGYPIPARTLAARRHNLKETIAALERRLSDLTDFVTALLAFLSVGVFLAHALDTYRTR